MRHDRCLQCLSPLNTNAGWEALFSWKKPMLCDECQEKLRPLTAPWCVHCSRPLPVTESCGDCERWAKTKNWSGLLTRNVSLFLYDEHLQEVLSAYKYRGDVELAKMFADSLKQTYRKYFKKSIPVPIPLSEERLQERGFNQAAALAEYLPVAYKPLLMRRVDEAKQSKRSRHGRLRGHVRPFAVREDVKSLTGQHILLIDDIYTTGTTLRKAAIPLLHHGAGQVSALTVARS
ncbi:ComF family protein [Natribacillus halophilus]|uniref:Competence protein ComFC n=1 Tax=Natribacillus halophilus TaxID=549003 RepID=A0A1G8KNU7_9BACI|nr:ComF family protein [Natribacillus halophilus]SDI45135.1 competence protein ComFC [Natribacillus halophilus]